jgi:hypothetical protein
LNSEIEEYDENQIIRDDKEVEINFDISNKNIFDFR